MFSSRYQSPGSTTEKGQVNVTYKERFHPVIKVRAVQPDSDASLVRNLSFHPVIKVRAVQLYPCRLLLCKRNFGGLRRGA